MVLKKYIDEYTVKDLPLSGVITIDIENDKGEIVETRTGVSNIPLAFEKDESLANNNGYYKYVEDVEPEYDAKTEYLSSKYVFDGEQITRVWVINEIPTDEVME
ncbi:MAG: hypothetical protein IKY67_05785 [Paludibacteraceae bacterium]|nr:hypothetical protein [Paludibacteraceae bacterium]